MIEKKIEDIEDIVIYERNKNGGVFITSDLHGHLVPLRIFIENEDLKLGKNDTIFICGDLIDRGPDSAGLVKYIIENNKKHENGASVPKIIVTLGNHEVMFLRWYAYCKTESDSEEMKSIRARFNTKDYTYEIAREEFFTNGGDWVKQVEEKELEKIFNYFKQLPIIVRVKGGHPFNIVHADLPDEWSKLSERKKLTPEEIDHATWARKNDEYVPEVKNPKGTGITYCGHSPKGDMRASTAKEPILNLDFETMETKLVCFVEHPSKTGSQPKLYLVVENKNGKGGSKEWTVGTIPFKEEENISKVLNKLYACRIWRVRKKIVELYEYLGYLNQGVVSDREFERKQPDLYYSSKLNGELEAFLGGGCSFFLKKKGPQDDDEKKQGEQEKNDRLFRIFNAIRTLW